MRRRNLKILSQIVDFLNANGAEITPDGKDIVLSDGRSVIRTYGKKHNKFVRAYGGTRANRLLMDAKAVVYVWKIGELAEDSVLHYKDEPYNFHPSNIVVSKRAHNLRKWREATHNGRDRLTTKQALQVVGVESDMWKGHLTEKTDYWKLQKKIKQEKDKKAMDNLRKRTYGSGFSPSKEQRLIVERSFYLGDDPKYAARVAKCTKGEAVDIYKMLKEKEQ